MTEEMLRLLAAQRREKKDLLLCIDRAWGACARQARQARRQLRRLEGVLALTTEEIKLQPGAYAPPAEGPRPGETPLEALNRRLAAAQQELRQYETKLFACERAILALKKENAELSALCAKARELGFAPADEEARGPFWPDGEGPAPDPGVPSVLPSVLDEPLPPSPPPEAAPAPQDAGEPLPPPDTPDKPAWLDAPMELLDQPGPHKPARRRAGPLDEMTSEVLGQLETLMQKENIPLGQSALLKGKAKP